MKPKLVIVFAAAFVLLSGLAHAASYHIDVQTIEVNPTHPHIGDELEIKARFYVSGPIDPKVKLYVYVDGKLKGSYIDFFDLGTNYHTFRVDTSSMYPGRKDVVVEAEVYEGSVLKDYSSKRTDVFLEFDDGVTTAHDITITQMSFKTPVLAGEKFAVTAFVKNTGALEERDVRVFVRIKDELERSDYFDIKRGETRAQTVYIRAPQTAGTYTITIEAENRAAHSVDSKIDVISASLTMNVVPETANVGEWITVSGYALAGADRPARSVTIYKDGQYSMSAYPDGSGYYSASVRFFTPGRHSVAARLGDLEKYAVVKVQEEEPYVPPVTPPVSGGQTIIIIQDGVVSITSDGTGVVDDGDEVPEPPPLNPYVSVSPSAKEVHVEQYRANTMYVDVSNHLGRTANFHIKTDFDQRLVFVPEVQTIQDGQTKTFALVFNPGDIFSGFISGAVNIYEEDNLVESLPVSVFVIQKRPRETVESGFEMPSFPVYYALIGLVALLAAASMAMHFRKMRPLEPKVLPVGAGRVVKGGQVRPMQRKLNVGGMRNIFRVPWENVIC